MMGKGEVILYLLAKLILWAPSKQTMETCRNLNLRANLLQTLKYGTIFRSQVNFLWGRFFHWKHSLVLFKNGGLHYKLKPTQIQFSVNRHFGGIDYMTFSQNQLWEVWGYLSRSMLGWCSFSYGSRRKNMSSKVHKNEMLVIQSNVANKEILNRHIVKGDRYLLNPENETILLIIA